MVLTSDYNERAPPGGSKMAGQFEKGTAFAAYVYPKPGGRRMERHELSSQHLHGHAMHRSSVFFTMAKEVSKPSRLRAQVDELRKQPMRKSLSQPAMATMEAKDQPADGAASSAALPASAATPDFSDIPADGLNRWYPHPATMRGTLKLSKPAALLWGVDPKKDQGHKCPFWEAEEHRFAKVAGLPEARPRTPTRAKRWSSDAEWDNPNNHATLKVNHSLPRPARQHDRPAGKLM
mmetsp:Transcript_97344/g.172349  ORF Transcript_97344/g.172349 Transcript_97344/m.172349 type:complete len:235 (-) Transcript_97344:70-774(-)